MPKTSFGEMEIILKNGNKPQVEYLKFTAEGRTHLHNEYESFFVMKGSGKVYVGKKIVEVFPGSLVVIPPNTGHWMKPADGVILEGLLWYHTSPLEIRS